MSDSKRGSLVLLAIRNSKKCSEHSMCGYEDNVESIRLDFCENPNRNSVFSSQSVHVQQ
uniref:Uncharacterized protein n=1 Tax=Solanum tuberosum TaxID=4113 RepID=M1D410_SOLTU